MKKNRVIKRPTKESRRSSYTSLLDVVSEQYEKPHELFVDFGLLLNNDYPEIAKVLFDEALILRPNSPYIKNKLNRLKDFDKNTLLQLPKSEAYAFIFIPKILRSNIRSHKFLYKKWVERILKVYSSLKLIVLIDIESDKTFSDFLVDSQYGERLGFSSYQKKNIKNVVYGLINEAGELPFFSLYFETVETQDNFIQRMLYKVTINVGVHCNPAQPVCSYDDISFLGYEARALETGNKFLPVIIEHNLPKPKQLKIRRKVIVSAFTSKRISSLFNKNDSLQHYIINFLSENPDWTWEIICDDSQDDFINKEIFECEQFKLIPLKNDLYGYFHQCSIYCMLPSMMGGDGTALLAVDAGLPIVAKNTKFGFLKYVTDKYVTKSEDDYFDFLNQLTSSKQLRQTVATYQEDYTNMLKSPNYDMKFKEYISEAKLKN